MATRRAFISKQSSSNQQSPPTMGHTPFTSGPPTGISVYGISPYVPPTPPIVISNYIGFDILGSASGSVTNYQIPIVVYRSTGTNIGNSVFLGTDIYSDYSNIYIRASDQVTAIPFYIESKTKTTASATIWISVPSIVADPSTTKVYLYWYTSGTYTSPSNGTITFPLLFDDFYGTDLSPPNASIWSVQLRGTSTSSTVRIISNSLVLTPTPNVTSSASILSVNTLPASGFSICIYRKSVPYMYVDTSFSISSSLVDSATTLYNSWWDTTLESGYNLRYGGTDATVRRQPTYTGSSQAYTTIITTSITPAPSQLETIEIQYTTSGDIYIVQNGSGVGSVNDTTFLSGQKYLLISQGSDISSIGNQETLEHVFVRSYIGPEPIVVSWGSINTP